MKNITILFGSLSGLLFIILAAFNQHYYKKNNKNYSIKNFKIAINYQIYHTLLILILASSLKINNILEKIILLLFMLGIIFFSGSIYLFYFQDNIQKKYNFLKFITPLGGIMLILGWLLLCINNIIILL